MIYGVIVDQGFVWKNSDGRVRSLFMREGTVLASKVKCPINCENGWSYIRDDWERTVFGLQCEECDGDGWITQ